MDYHDEEFNQYLESTIFTPATKPLLCVEVFTNKTKTERIVQKQVREDDIETWLTKASSPPTANEEAAVYLMCDLCYHIVVLFSKHRRQLRSIDQEDYSAFNKESWHMKKSTYEKIHRKFNLSRFDSGISRGRDVIVEYLRGRVTQNNAVSHWASTSGQYLWHTEPTGTTRAIVQLRDKDGLQQFLASLSTYISLGHGHSTMLLTTVQLDAERYRVFSLQSLNDIQKIESSTGYDYFTSDKKALNQSLLKELNLRLSKTRQLLSLRRMQLCANERKFGQCVELLHLHQKTVYGEVVSYYKDLLSAFREELVSMESRARIQQDTLYNLIAREDSAANIQLAKDSRRIAIASQRDSASMKTISVLTMVFLPGTFVAAVFAMPCFHWFAAPGEPVSTRFWVFWVVTVPLTLGVVLIWWYWKEWRHQQDVIEDRRGVTDAAEGKDCDSQDSPDASLAKPEDRGHRDGSNAYDSLLRLFTKKRKPKEIV